MSADTLAPGLRLGDRYTLLAPLGHGGMATVWSAQNESGQRVAVKILTAEFATDQGVVARFFLEARAAGVIAHPGIVRVFDTGQTSWGAPYMVMEELSGLSLSELLAHHWRFTPAQASAVLVPVLDAVAAAHAAGVIHRDLKPGNVFITLTPSPAVKLLDFGISKVRTVDEARLTQTGMVFGTPAYMSPEQLRDSKGALAASDLYSVGAMAFELVTGRLPFLGDNPAVLASNVLTADLPSLRVLRPELPLEWCRLVERALSKDPALRPPRAHVFKEQLETLAPPETSWLFTRTRELSSRTVPAREPARRSNTRVVGPMLSLAQLVDRLDRLGQRVPAPVAVHCVCELLLDPSTPPVLSPAQVAVSVDGHARGEPGAPLKSQRGAKLQSFVAPEAWDGAPSALSLQFSLAAVVVHALTGHAPFEADSAPALRAQLEKGLVVALPEGLPPALTATLARMLAVDPMHRFADGGACADALSAPFRTMPLYARAPEELAALLRSVQQASVMKRAPTRMSAAPERSGISGVGALVVALLALGGGVGISVWRLREAAKSVPVEEVVVEPEQVAPPPVRRLVEEAEPVPAVAGPASDYAVTSEPAGAALWIEGVFRGNAPGALSLPQGKTFTLRLVLPAHEMREVSLTADGSPHPLAVVLKSQKRLGRVRFAIEDHERVWLDGELVAEGQIELPVEAEVPHSLQLEAGGVRGEVQTFSVGAGLVKTLK